METKKTIIETTTQVTTDNAIYDITTSKVDGVITSIKADVAESKKWYRNLLYYENGVLVESESIIFIGD